MMIVIKNGVDVLSINHNVKNKHSTDMELTGEVKYLRDSDVLVSDIKNLAQITFLGENPEMEWKFFRDELRKLKKEHIASYNEYMESEDDTEYPETEWAKFKRESRS